MEHATSLHGGQRRLTVRIASGETDLAAVQRLRWQVFHAEMGAQPAEQHCGGIDADPYDAVCDHLLVIDEELGRDVAVGTYRLLRESVASGCGGFYTENEFDISPLFGSDATRTGELLELGRSCVLPAYRTSGTISLLWRGIGEYITRHDISLMFGCASFPGTDPAAHAEALSYLSHRHLAPAGQCPRLLAGKGVPLGQLAEGSYDERRAMLTLPPLVKGYLRAGAKFGDGAFIDRDFNTIDVCVVMPTEHIAMRYVSRFSAAA